MVLAVLMFMSACADDSENRSFANDPRTPSDRPTEQASPTTRMADEATPVLPSPESLVHRRGAPTTIYTYVDGALRSIDGDAAYVIVNNEVSAFAASPDGSHIAVVTSEPADNGEMAYSITIHAPDGNVTATFEDVLRVPADAATPASQLTSAAPQIDISWDAEGKRLLLTHPSGRLIDIPLDGEPQEIETSSSIAGVIQAAWSPQGDSIGLLRRNDDGQGELAIVDTSGDTATVTVIAPSGASSDGQRSVESFEWKPDGSGVLYLEMRRTDQGLQGGTIIGWDRTSNSTMIVATGGQAGPSGSVTSFSLSPDGKAVAYRVALPGEDGWSFNGLFIRALESGQLYRVQVPPNAAVTGAWWFSGGLVRSQVRQVEGRDTIVEIVLTDATGAETELAAYSLAPPATPGAPGATPVASEATPLSGGASPEASPVASPVATPLASPVATPDVSSGTAPANSPG